MLKIPDELPTISPILFFIGICVFGLVYSLGRLTKHIRFAKRFLARYTRVINNRDNESYEWLLRNLFQIREEMEAHGASYFRIGNIITNLHDLPDILPPNLSDVSVDLTKYIGRLCFLRRKLLLHVLCPLVWPIHMVDMILQLCNHFGVINTISKKPAIQRITAICTGLLILYGIIADWEGFTKTFRSIMKFFST